MPIVLSGLGTCVPVDGPLMEFPLESMGWISDGIDLGAQNVAAPMFVESGICTSFIALLKVSSCDIL